MTLNIQAAFLLAQGGAAGPAEGPGLWDWMLLMGPFLVLFYLFFVLPETQKNKKRQQQLDSLQKNDTVVTIGGVHGIVASVDKEKGIVVLKIDESKDVRVRFSVSSISEVVKDAKKEEDSEKKS